MQAAPAPARAQSWVLTPFLGASAAIDSPAAGHSIGLGVAVACDPTSTLGFEGGGSHLLHVGAPARAIDWSVMNVSANAVYQLGAARIRPYATFGVGMERSRYTLRSAGITDPSLQDEMAALGLDPDAVRNDSVFTRLAVNVGGGLKIALTERVVARADARRFQASSPAADYWRVYAGITFVMHAGP